MILAVLNKVFMLQFTLKQIDKVQRYEKICLLPEKNLSQTVNAALRRPTSNAVCRYQRFVLHNISQLTLQNVHDAENQMQQNIVIFFINKFLATIPPSSLQKESYQISYSKQSTKQSTKNILSPTKEANIKCEQNVDIDRTVPMSILQVNKKQFKLPIVRYTFLTKLINGYSKNTDCQLVIAKLACFKITNKFTNKNSKN
eukprot:TRINITY_DN6593_c1_g3_i1.p2 TRINITY_DN6593_c1_g3~~TRINITY_DN6593_c1_g3_i1.p2  ORF type:complete len:200 (-),score=-1.09 TRINITY_DN6593_c1_g3_i1:630-1229(-)